MSNPRLTNGARHELRDIIMKSLFAKREKANAIGRDKLAMDVVYDTLGPKGKKLLKEIPAGWLREESSIRASFAGQIVSIEFADKDGYHIQRELPKKFHWNVVNVYDRDHALTERHDELHAEYERLKAEKSAMYNQITALVNSVHSVKALLEVWPEAKDYIPKTWFKAKETLPAINIALFNEKIDELKAVAAA